MAERKRDRQDNDATEPPGDLVTVGDIDDEIARLQAERERVSKIMTDPAQKRARRAVRGAAMMRWVAARGLDADQLEELRGHLPTEDQWMAKTGILLNDGWTQETSGRWSPEPQEAAVPAKRLDSPAQ